MPMVLSEVRFMPGSELMPEANVPLSESALMQMLFAWNRSCEVLQTSDSFPSIPGSTAMFSIVAARLLIVPPDPLSSPTPSSLMFVPRRIISEPPWNIVPLASTLPMMILGEERIIVLSSRTNFMPFVISAIWFFSSCTSRLLLCISVSSLLTHCLKSSSVFCRSSNIYPIVVVPFCYVITSGSVALKSELRYSFTACRSGFRIASNPAESSSSL